MMMLVPEAMASSLPSSAFAGVLGSGRAKRTATAGPGARATTIGTPDKDAGQARAWWAIDCRVDVKSVTAPGNHDAGMRSLPLFDLTPADG